MTSEELKAYLALIEERTKNRVNSIENQIEKVDSRISALHQEIKHYKEYHSSEHSHGERESNLKVEVYQQQYAQLSKKLDKVIADIDNEKDRDIIKKQLSAAEKGIIVAVAIFIISIVLDFFDINYKSLSKTVSSSNPTEQPSNRPDTKEKK